MYNALPRYLRTIVFASGLAVLPSTAMAMNHQNQQPVVQPCNGTMMSTPTGSNRERQITVSMHHLEQAYLAGLNWLRQNNQHGARLLTPPITMVREQQLRQGNNYRGGATFVDAQYQIYAQGHIIFTELYVDLMRGPENTQRIVIRADGNHEGFYSPDHYQHFCAIRSEAAILQQPSAQPNGPHIEPTFQTPNP